MEFRVFQTKMGWAGIAGSGDRVSLLVLPMQERDDVLSAIRGGITRDLVETEHSFRGAVDQLCAYFSGSQVDFICDVDLSAGTDFDRRVWESACTIPFGESKSYGWIAERIGCPKGARAVGQALGRNPIPVIVPCHRILQANRRLGGFSAGIDWKARLLALEGIHHNEPTTRKK